ncbi:hypothetical protein MUK42_13289 [Musa troglodytarum]|uniref:Uncharacterized protein n=1 Tax=Musa troglodytarum TaxID=320322 RepID=A0A9E7H5F3_9LILI|nr:hypothetical protein MUK42_13289 [Musa troglodytarum]URE27091.1 hypothetical protein MUK42_13289 [Musa troglodytarum]
MQHNSIPRALEKKLSEKIGILDSAQINYYYAVLLVKQAVGSFSIVYMHAGVRLVCNTLRKHNFQKNSWVLEHWQGHA